VFDRLHANVRPAARPGTGTGLGLAIVLELVQAMGGKVVATDAAGGGARLVVRLPRRVDGVDSSA
jgi:signal transduction histidine kinase